MQSTKWENLYTTEIIIYCAGQYGNEVLIQGSKLNWNICCFCDKRAEKYEGDGYFINDIPVYDFEDAHKTYPQAVMIIAHSDYAECLRIGRKIEKQGFVKNKTYFIAIELEMKGILPVIRTPFHVNDRKIILIGLPYLCDCFIEWMGNDREQIEVCYSEKDVNIWNRKFPDALWIPLHREPLEIEYDKKIRSIIGCLANENVLYTDYFLKHLDYCDGGRQLEPSGKAENNAAYKILFNILPNNVGNSFLNGVLDGHPEILYFGMEMYVWTNNLWDIVQIAAKEKGTNVVEMIVEKIREYTLKAWDENINAVTVISLPDKDLVWLDRYQEFLLSRMDEERQYSQKEILLNMHLAWKEANYTRVSGKETVIYMDIHSSCILWESYNMIVRWLENLGFEVVLLQMIRRPYAQSASTMKTQIALGNFQKNVALWTLTACAFEELYGELGDHKILRLRFEDVKQYPKAVLKRLCHELQISWNESMLETTSSGKMTKCTIRNEEITGYDMKPVWYPYDEFFDAFDKFRMDILCRAKCKAYDYPYVSEEKYPVPLNELVELFILPFQFEKYIVFADEAERLKFRQTVKEYCKNIIYWQENDEHKQFFCFGPYLSATN